ncbi:GNAT family N-acetyltransferase [Caballeronia sp. LZ065]|uniref:GNAT family N-acetyltransferase n=1 Tax=Caballeronia sp. LZ065 TaxID=3038571 RepID=UPI002864EBC6|nr:GNAT family N-acetyltransferase [Caballeronia sp. LZ065]MDR5780080.1 GNAT family N-acetyltransferase [Caballeronia sp. LZ065]
MPNVKPTIETPGSLLVLRDATPGDRDLIVSMHVRSWTSAYRGILPDRYLDRDIHAERAAHWAARLPELARGAGRVVIALHDDEAVGFTCLIEPDEHGSVLVDNLHALPRHKGLGAGTAMLAEAIRWARERGARQLHLSVLEENAAAIGFYESRGWRREAREADHMAGIDLFSLRYVLPLD